ncbi:Sjogrens syndrome scleroderma autoantigen 1 [Staphylothermus marinus F1]|uniref:Sjogrens syndrome scleroderma autoantigen 1 n=1 Tax=Staphylothermus marinus (strain ATCC 43588 / DSM 3639 / JCM 9404 / F1) TaxID=399550 RepID=A3DM72_STAMF|nr:Sjogren's syndrome/scleroderma autoantigen 1 family protein [Staphylothermus marinus]ABN69732.1 Sjogrens syndrome scleroderma autoantigen 1 [Staphylothermus marinus F1]
MSGKIDPVKKMAELLKSGATMLAETCPVKGCNLPLFKLPSGEIVCPVHGKVYMVKTEEEALEVKEKLSLRSVLDKLENKVLLILDDLSNNTIPQTSELIEWLEVLERIRRIKKLISEK